MLLLPFLTGSKCNSDKILLVDVQILLINFRKEILACIPKKAKGSHDDSSDDCSDVLVVSESMALVAHNEDANVALVGHT